MNRDNKNEPTIQANDALSSSYSERPGLKIWDDVVENVEALVTKSDYERWIQHLRLIAEIDGEIVIATKDPLSFDRIANSKHMALIQRIWRKHDPKSRRLRLVCWRTAGTNMHALVDDPWATALSDAVEAPAHEAMTGADTADIADIDEGVSTPEMTFDNLITGPSNNSAFRFAYKVATGIKVGTPLTLFYGPPGIGKSHLLTALVHESEARKLKRKIVSVTAEEFLAAYQEGVKARDTVELKKRLQSADVLLVDDLHRISGKRSTENELFQNLREVTGKGGQVILVSDVCAGDIKGFSPRMCSELKGGTSIPIELPDADMRRGIVVQLADHILQHAPNFVLNDAMVDQIITGIRGPGRELCGAVWSLYIAADFGADAPTEEMLTSIIRQQQGERPKPTLDLIKRAAMKVFEISKTDIESKSKAQVVVYPRQIAMYICREMTGKSFPQIARSFHKLDHTTVIYACKKVEKKMKITPELKQDVETVRRMVLDLQMASKAS